jgi:hypothetical protein
VGFDFGDDWGWTEPGGCLDLFLALVFCPSKLERARCVDTPY